MDVEILQSSKGNPKLSVNVWGVCVYVWPSMTHVGCGFVVFTTYVRTEWKTGSIFDDACSTARPQLIVWPDGVSKSVSLHTQVPTVARLTNRLQYTTNQQCRCWVVRAPCVPHTIWTFPKSTDTKYFHWLSCLKFCKVVRAIEAMNRP